MENRNRNIDGIKGCLVLLVVVGHVLQGRLDQSIGRYMIYGFHMPFFIALAGICFRTHDLVAIHCRFFWVDIGCG